jgi:hypothetical protein
MEMTRMVDGCPGCEPLQKAQETISIGRSIDDPVPEHVRREIQDGMAPSRTMLIDDPGGSLSRPLTIEEIAACNNDGEEVARQVIDEAVAEVKLRTPPPSCQGDELYGTHECCIHGRELVLDCDGCDFVGVIDRAASRLVDGRLDAALDAAVHAINMPGASHMSAGGGPTAHLVRLQMIVAIVAAKGRAL